VTTPSPPTILLNLASAAGLIGAGLYYTGWVYRWAYFAYYQLGITSLDFPVESFLLLPLQVFFGTPQSIVNTLIIALLIPILFQLSTLCLAFLHWQYQQWLTRLKNWQLKRQNQRNRRKIPYAPRPRFQRQLTLPLVSELILLSWILLLIFHLARDQGLKDARRDAVNPTSTLPVVTLISAKELLILGKEAGDLDPNQPLFEALTPEDQQSLIGDPNLARIIQQRNLTDTEQDRVWRLLLERGGWLYLFRALPQDAPKTEHPVLLGVAKSNVGRQLLILSPEPVKSTK